MQTIIRSAIVLLFSLIVQLITAQDSIPKTINQNKIDLLKETRAQITAQEKAYLKAEVEAINKRLERGEITNEEAKKLKMEVAKKRALNIENRTAILNNKIALLERNEEGYEIDTNEKGNDEDNEGTWINIKIKDKEKKKKKYDRRTTNDFVLAFGLNNAIVEGESLDDSPYKFLGSHFLELGWAWKYRVFENTNFVRLKYGLSLQINSLKPEDNMYFVQSNNQTLLETFPENLKKSKFTMTNLVVPIHFEFGASKKTEHKTYFRYSTRNRFKFGVGGYAGLNVSARQKLKYTMDGDKIKDKQKNGFNNSNLIYGVSGYLAKGDVAIYIKYDLSPIFKDQITEQHNISLGLRFDMD